MMIIHKIIGAVMILVPLTIWLWWLEPDSKKAILQVIFVFLMMISIIIGCGFLAGCTTTRTVEVPVPVACVQPKLPAEPHYPIHDLKKDDSPATVVKAYVATVAGQHDYIERVKYIYAGDK